MNAGRGMREENQDGAGREIKFRAWDEGNKIMHHDFQFVKSGETGGDWILFVSDRQPIGSRNSIGLRWDKNPYFAQQFKVMQFTGLKDKTGRDVYEGDILYFDLQDAFGGDHFHAAEVVCGGAAFGCVLKYRDGQEGWIGLNEIQQDDEETEILGNIYENPDLLGASAHGEAPEPQPDPSNLGPQGQQGEQ